VEIALMQTIEESAMQNTMIFACSFLLGDQDEEPLSTRGK